MSDWTYVHEYLAGAVRLDGERLVVIVDDLLVAAKEANDDFDVLAFEQDRFPVGGDVPGTTLAANLSYLRDTLDELAKAARAAR